MRSVNIQQAKTHLSRLVEDAARGEEIVIAKAGKPLVRLVPWRADATPRPLGVWKGKVWIADDFDETPEAIVRLFEGTEKKLPGERAPRRKPRPRAAKRK